MDRLVKTCYRCRKPYFWFAHVTKKNICKKCCKEKIKMNENKLRNYLNNKFLFKGD